MTTTGQEQTLHTAVGRDGDGVETVATNLEASTLAASDIALSSVALMALTLALLALVAAMMIPAPVHAAGWRIEPVASEPPRPKGANARVAVQEQRVADKPRDRLARFNLVMALRDAGRLEDALAAAKAWRAHDAYNLLAARLVGDLYAALGQPRAALRSWSAVVELLPNDASAHRALASALKQAGALEAACGRLQRAVSLHPDDTRLGFELADCAYRQGHLERAREGFERIAANEKTPKLIAMPSKQRLAQVYAQLARRAGRSGKRGEAKQLRKLRNQLVIDGGTSSDLKVFLTWDTDRSDVDLWVITPTGERIFYSHKRGKHGGALFGDVTTGYGPETFSAPRATRGVYQVIVHYFGTRRRGLREARGEVAIVLHEGTSREVRKVLPYRLYKPRQKVTVARIHVTARKHHRNRGGVR